MVDTNDDAPWPSPRTPMASWTMSPNDWTRPPLNRPGSFGSSFCPEKAQIDPARKLLIGVGLPFPVISPADATPPVTTTIAAASAAAASGFLMVPPCPPRQDAGAGPGPYCISPLSVALRPICVVIRARIGRLGLCPAESGSEGFKGAGFAGTWPAGGAFGAVLGRRPPRPAAGSTRLS